MKSSDPSQKATVTLETPAFKSLLSALYTTKEKAQSLIGNIQVDNDTTEAIIQLFWEIIFEFFVQTEGVEHTLSDINTLASIIQKLAATYNQSKTLEVKLHDQRIKQEDFLQKQEKIANSLKEACQAPGGLTPETLAAIEAQLKLL